jgi:hypothetical protein
MTSLAWRWCVVAVALVGCGGSDPLKGPDAAPDTASPRSDGGATLDMVAADSALDGPADRPTAGPDGPGDVATTGGGDVARDAAVVPTDVPVQPERGGDLPAPPGPDGPQGGTGGAGGGPDGPPVDRNPGARRQVDILFLVDNSPSMQEEQANLARNFPAMIDELKGLPGGLPDLHIAIASSDLGAGPTAVGSCTRPGGDRGIFQTKAGCGLEAGARFMVSRNGGANNNFTGEISQVFQCLAQLGAQGCGFEHQLQATRVALYETITPENRGFLRPDAVLVVVLLSDEDDCSAEVNSDLFTEDIPGTTASFRCARFGHVCGGQMPPQAPFSAPLSQCRPSDDGGRLIRVGDVVDSVKILKRNPAEDILVAGLFGWSDQPGAEYRYATAAGAPAPNLEYQPICSSINGSATAAVRLKQFVEGFGANGTFRSICDDDYRPAMKHIGEALRRRLAP